MARLEKWRELLEHENIAELRELSRWWPTCAVGEKLGLGPEAGKDHELNDELSFVLWREAPKLYRLGVQFAEALDWSSGYALRILEKIEDY